MVEVSVSQSSLKETLLLTALNILAAAVVTALVIMALGENPFDAFLYILNGTFGSWEGFGYTLYYATSFVFTGLAVAIAFHGGLFNIGGEGQALFGGVGLTFGIFLFGDSLPVLSFFGGLVGAMLFGALWALVPAYMQAYRGSPTVITTIMFNYIAAGVLAYLLTGPLMRADSAMPESEDFPHGVGMMSFTDFFAIVGIDLDLGSANLSFLFALIVAYGVWFMLWRTNLGYTIRVTGANKDAAHYAGFSVQRITVIAMLLSGAVAGLMGVNELMGEQSRLINGFTLGAGFVGIAVAFMGRNHPIGIVLSALLFGFLAQGGVELAFEMDNVTQYLVVVIQGVVILFAGALENLFKKPVKQFLARPSAPSSRVVQNG